MQKRELIGIFVRFKGGLMHQAANRKVGQQEAIELLLEEVRRFAEQHDLRTAQMGFQFIQGGLDLPTFMVSAASSAAGAALWSIIVVTRRY